MMKAEELYKLVTILEGRSGGYVVYVTNAPCICTQCDTKEEIPRAIGDAFAAMMKATIDNVEIQKV